MCSLFYSENSVLARLDQHHGEDVGECEWLKMGQMLITSQIRPINATVTGLGVFSKRCC